jgi:hypothetical protein
VIHSTTSRREAAEWILRRCKEPTAVRVAMEGCEYWIALHHPEDVPEEEVGECIGVYHYAGDFEKRQAAKEALDENLC